MSDTIIVKVSGLFFFKDRIGFKAKIGVKNKLWNTIIKLYMKKNHFFPITILFGSLTI